MQIENYNIYRKFNETKDKRRTGGSDARFLLWSESCIDALESIQFSWTGKQESEYDRWLFMYFRVLFLRCRHGQGADLRPYYKLYRGLAEWVRQQDRDCSYRNSVARQALDICHRKEGDCWTQSISTTTIP